MSKFKKMSRKIKVIFITLVVVTISLLIVRLLSIFDVGVFSTIGDWFSFVNVANSFFIAVFFLVEYVKEKRIGENAGEQEDDIS